MITLLIFILIYLISVFLHWLHIHFSHSKGGIFAHYEIDNGDWVLMLVPLINTVFAIVMWIARYPIKFSNYKFFKLK